MNLQSSTNKQGEIVTQIIHFSDGSKKTIEDIRTETIKQGQFTQFLLEDGRLIYINDKNVNMIEVFKGDRMEALEQIIDVELKNKS